MTRLAVLLFFRILELSRLHLIDLLCIVIKYSSRFNPFTVSLPLHFDDLLILDVLIVGQFTQVFNLLGLKTGIEGDFFDDLLLIDFLLFEVECEGFTHFWSDFDDFNLYSFKQSVLVEHVLDNFYQVLVFVLTEDSYHKQANSATSPLSRHSGEKMSEKKQHTLGIVETPDVNCS